MQCSGTAVSALAFFCHTLTNSFFLNGALYVQVFLALLQPTTLVNDSEVAQDSPSGMLTMYVDPRTGEAWLTADINNIQNLTAVTLNAVSRVRAV